MRLLTLREIEETRETYSYLARAHTRKIGQVNLELVLQIPDNQDSEQRPKFIWLENGEPSKLQEILFLRYNPELKRVIDTLDSLEDGERLGRREVEKLLGIQPLAVCTYLINKGRNFDRTHGDIRRKKLPLQLVYEITAAFMPTIEKWKTISEMRKELQLKINGAGYCKKARIESKKDPNFWRISPIGMNQLRNLVRPTEAIIEGVGYSIRLIAEEARKRQGRGRTSKNLEAYEKRISGLLENYPQIFPSRKRGGRIYVEPRIATILIDSITPKQTRMLTGLTAEQIRIRRNKGKIKSYRLGKRFWYSLDSIRAYMSTSEYQESKARKK
jgi:hypothetical protein